MSGLAPASKVLVVDDRPGNLLSLQAVLDPNRYDIVTARSGEEALAAVLEEDFACIILDVAMPSMDGFETARLIKERERSRTIPILFVTASVLDIEHVFEGYTVGAVDYLQKPVNPHALRAKVRVFVDLHEQAREIERQARALEEARLRERELLQRRANEEIVLREQAVEALDLSEARFRVLEESGLIGVVHFELDGGITAGNEAFWHLLGYRQPAAMSLAELVPPERRAVEETELLDLRSEGVLPVAEKELVRADGGRVFALVGRAVIRREGTRKGVGFVVDVTARKQIETERARILGDLRAAVRARDEFLSIAAHELRTPLTPLRLQIDALGRSIPEHDLEARQRLSRLDRSARRLERLINELLDVSRVSAGRLRLEPEVVDIAQIVKEVAERWRHNREGVEIRVLLPDAGSGADGSVGTWDRMRIEQVVENLVSNALKYGAGRPVEVVLEAVDEGVRLKVIDQGEGIPPEDRDRIFQRFERLGRHRQHGGFGLGLWIAKQAIEAHGGTIGVTSRQGKGTEFTVFLPRTPPESAMPQPRAASSPAAHPRGA